MKYPSNLLRNKSKYQYKLLNLCIRTDEVHQAYDVFLDKNVASCNGNSQLATFITVYIFS